MRPLCDAVRDGPGRRRGCGNPAWRSRAEGWKWRPSSPAVPGGLDHDSAVSSDTIVTVPVVALGRQLGFLLADQEPAFSEAIRTAFDLW